MRPTPQTRAMRPTPQTRAMRPTPQTRAMRPTPQTRAMRPTPHHSHPSDATDTTERYDRRHRPERYDRRHRPERYDRRHRTDRCDRRHGTERCDRCHDPSDLLDASSPTEDERTPGTLTFSWLENYPVKLLRVVRSAQSDQFVSISTPNAQGDSFIFKHSFSAPQEQNSVTTTSIIAEGTQLHDLVTLGSSLWLVGSIGEAGVLWTLGEGQEDIELTPQAEAPYGVFIAITSFADELFLLERSPGSGAWIHRVFRFDSGSMVLEQVGAPHVSSVGCDDLAVFYDPYSEILKPTLACGNNGGEVAIWDESLNAWSRTTNVGNSARIEASPNGETGFFIQWSGPKGYSDTSGRSARR